MARGDNMMASFRGDEDPSSPTTIIFKNMQAAGIPLNAGNIRTYMQKLRMSPEGPPGQFDMGARDDKTGNMESLRVERGSDDTRGSVASKVEPQGNQGNAGNVDTRSGDQRTAARQPPGDDGGSPNTSAQPTQSTPGSTTTPGLPGMPGDDDYSLGRSGLGGIILGGLPAAYAAYKGMSGGGLAAGGGGAPTVDISSAGGATPTGGSGTPISPMESAMLKATAPPGPIIPGVMPQGTPNVTIDTSPQLSGAPSPINPQITTPQPDFSFQPQPKLSGRPPPIDFVQPRPSMPFRPNSAELNALKGLGRFIK